MSRVGLTPSGQWRTVEDSGGQWRTVCPLCVLRLAHWEWLDTHKMVLTPVVRYERLVLPPTPRLAQMMGNMTAVVSDHPRRRSGRPVRVKSFYSIARVLYVVILYIIFRKYDDRDAESSCSTCMCSSFCGASVASSCLIQPLRSPVYCSHETCRFPGKLVRLRQPGRPISPRSHSGRSRLLLHGRVPSLHVADAA